MFCFVPAAETFPTARSLWQLFLGPEHPCPIPPQHWVPKPAHEELGRIPQGHTQQEPHGQDPGPKAQPGVSNPADSTPKPSRDTRGALPTSSSSAARLPVAPSASSSSSPSSSSPAHGREGEEREPPRCLQHPVSSQLPSWGRWGVVLGQAPADLTHGQWRKLGFAAGGQAHTTGNGSIKKNKSTPSPSAEITAHKKNKRGNLFLVAAPPNRSRLLLLPFAAISPSLMS